MLSIQVARRTSRVARRGGILARCLSSHDDFAPKRKATSADATSANDVHARIEADVKKHPVALFMKGTKEQPMCGFSAHVVQILNAEGASFTSFNVLADPELREGIKSYSAWPTIPQVYVNGEFIGGCDTTIEMYKSGELATMLKEAGVKQ